jgi:hypothetical protein
MVASSVRELKKIYYWWNPNKQFLRFNPCLDLLKIRIFVHKFNSVGKYITLYI